MQRVIDAIAKGLNSDSSSLREEAKRLFHGRGQCFSDLEYINVDWYDPVILITLYAEPDNQAWQQFERAMHDIFPLTGGTIVQRRYQTGSPSEIIYGQLPDQPIALEQGLKYKLSLAKKQNIGFFIDMEPGRAWVQEVAANKRVLNLFAYTCSLSVAAIAGSAKTVVNLDMSRAALTIGRENHRLNGHDEKLKRDIQFLPYNLFRSWKKVIQKGPYDLVIIDPPSRQKGSFVAESDYARVVRRLPQLMPEGGDILACLNAPELGDDFLQRCFENECSQASFIARLENSPDFPEMDPKRNLKLMHYQL